MTSNNSSDDKVKIENLIFRLEENDLEERIKILIIDDGIDLGRLLLNCLKKENYQPIYAENRIIGLEKMKKSKFYLIILDIMLPGVDGFL